MPTPAQAALAALADAAGTTASTDPTDDRTVVALVHESFEGEWDEPITRDDLAQASAIVLRVVRDDMMLEAIDGKLPAFPEIERYLNARISLLTGKPTMTGDTTEPGAHGY